jgi:hypothetical protein
MEEVNAALRERERIEVRRTAQPMAAIMESQSVRSTEAGGSRGHNGGKMVTGRKRHVLVNTQDNLLKSRAAWASKFRGSPSRRRVAMPGLGLHGRRGRRCRAVLSPFGPAARPPPRAQSR